MSGNDEYKKISKIADAIQALSVFIFIIAGFPVTVVVVAFVDAAQNEGSMAVANVWRNDQIFHAGVLLALGGITLGVGRILQVLENRNT